MHPRIKLQIVNFSKNFILCETKNEVRLQSFTQPVSILMNILSQNSTIIYKFSCLQQKMIKNIRIHGQIKLSRKGRK